MSNLYYRAPISFGPFPGPRQAHDGTVRHGHSTTSVTANITFKTPKQGLRDLFPNDSYTFQDSGPTGYVTFSSQRLDNLEWLAGRGYNLFAIYIHGVRYIAKDGKEYKGTFLPLMLENLADPIISGREELGYPKLYTTLDVLRTDDTYDLKIGWEGSSFGSFKVEGLSEVTNGTASFAPSAAGEDNGVLVHRYIPAVGAPGSADADYTCWVLHAAQNEECESKVVREWKADHVSVSFDPLTWKELPTLHHIISRLAGISVIDVVGANVVEKIGLTTLRSTQRI